MRALVAQGITFTLPGGGVRVRGDLQLQLHSAAGLVASGEEFGWLQLHTSGLEGRRPVVQEAVAGHEDGVGGEAHGEARGEAAGAAVAASSSSLGSSEEPPLRVASFCRSEVDAISVDRRFPADWSIELHYKSEPTSTGCDVLFPDVRSG